MLKTFSDKMSVIIVTVMVMRSVFHVGLYTVNHKKVAEHTFIMHSLNITRCIKLNDRPDSIIHQIEVW